MSGPHLLNTQLQLYTFSDLRCLDSICTFKKWIRWQFNHSKSHLNELTVQEAVVFEAASAEQCVKGMQALFALHRASVGTVDVRRAFRGQRAGQLLLRQLLISDTQTHTQKEKHELNRNLLRHTYTHTRVSTESVRTAFCLTSPSSLYVLVE